MLLVKKIIYSYDKVLNIIVFDLFFTISKAFFWNKFFLIYKYKYNYLNNYIK